MTDEVEIPPRRVYARTDPGVDPSAIAFGLELEAHMAEGEIVLFVDHDAEPVRMFELHRAGGAFRLRDGLTAPRGAFASAEAAIRAGWAMVDALLSDADAGLGGDLPSFAALLGSDDPTGGGA